MDDKAKVSQAGAQAASGSRRSNGTQVVARFRPLAATGLEAKSKPCVENLDATRVTFCADNERDNSSFTFDRVFGPDSTQSDVFDVCKETAERALLGFNGTVLQAEHHTPEPRSNATSSFEKLSDLLAAIHLNAGAIIAYGQTSAGKTHTMGTACSQSADPATYGLIPRLCSHLAELIAATGRPQAFTLKLSVVEVYQERIRDLLEPKSDNLQLHEDKVQGVYIGGVKEVTLKKAEDAVGIIGGAVRSRTVGSTLMNADSSRSHFVVLLTVESRSPSLSESGGVVCRTGKMCLVDLAGSEKVKKTGATGNCLQEAITINKSLSALGNVISALTTEPDAVPRKASGGATGSSTTSGPQPPTAASSAKLKPIPYRDSKLTFLLRDCLGGNAYTTLIVCLSPAQFNAAETLSTLRFGSRAKAIRNAPIANAVEMPTDPKQLQQELKQCRAQIEDLQRERADQARA